jgi:hypothetical protein
LVEIIITIAVSALVIFGGLAALVGTAASWDKGRARMDAEIESAQAIRFIRDHLREAMEVTVDVDGKGVTYRLPLKDANGDYIAPAQWDGVVRRFEVRPSGKLFAVDGGNERVLVEDVALQDPRNGNPAPYQQFTPGPGGITRIVTVQIVTQRQIHREGSTAYGRNRETVILRNTPILIN